MRATPGQTQLSVIIPTHNRAELLGFSLQSLVKQSLPKSGYEVIVVDDGSSDGTADVCQRLANDLPLRYYRLRHSGISSAKNLGIFTAAGSILFFFDDDDVAHEDLLLLHWESHQEHPEENTAILGYTTWEPSLPVTEVMHYVTEVGQFLFAYRNLRTGQELDFTYFWGGRTSCKRSFLVKNGIFRQEFHFGSEDIELGFRLARFGLKIIYNSGAVQYMNRALTYEDYCNRCEKQGKSQMQFSRLHSDSIVHEWCQTTDALARWGQISRDLPSKVAWVHAIEAMLKECVDPTERQVLLGKLHQLYKWTFDAFKLKGIAEAMAGHQRPAAAASPDVIASPELA